MGSEQNREEKLCFMLAQLRDDLGDLIGGLESKSLSYEATVAGAMTQMTWVLNELTRNLGEARQGS
jgi:hypothetical protein